MIRFSVRRFLLFCFLPAILFKPLEMRAQLPVLRIISPDASGADRQATMLQSLHIDVQVAGNVATTVMTLAFKNNGSRTLEGELTFPLPEGVAVSRYAVDIQGKMREAVPVEKARAAEVFESIERRGIDPGLLEKVTGNSFRTRIYPLPAGGTRTVLIGYEEELSSGKAQALRYHLPLDYKQAIPDFSLKATVYETTEKPELEEQPDGSFTFGNATGKNYTASVVKANYQPQKSLTIVLPKSNDMPEVLLQPAGESAYFFVNLFPKAQSRPRVWSDHIGLLWDVSLSGLQRDIPKELDLLDAVIRQKQNLTVTLGLVNNRFTKAGTFTIKNGDWHILRSVLERLTYDGGTDFSKIQTALLPADEYLFFTDGLSTFGEADFTVSKPVYCVSSGARADYSTLQYISRKSGGRFTNLSVMTAGGAARALAEEPLQFIGIRPTATLTEVYPSMPVSVDGHLAIAGIMQGKSAMLTLQFGYGGKVLFEKNVTLAASAATATGIDISRVWAQKKIAEMDIRYEQNKEDIGILSRQFGVVTRNTSLLVLENVSDYVRYGIDPPVELRVEYDRLRKADAVAREERVNNLLTSALETRKELTSWWTATYAPKKKYPVPTATTRFTPPVIARDEAVRDAGSTGASAHAVTDAAPPAPPRAIQQEQIEHSPAGSMSLPSVAADGMEDKVRQLTGSPGLLSEVVVAKQFNGASAESFPSTQLQPDIAVPEFKTDEAYMKKLRNVPRDSAYAQYLAMRGDYITTPLFYYHVANWFYTQKDSTTALMILSNIADLDLENAQLYKLLAYRLKQTGNYDAEIFITKKVLQWRPMESQSYRDYGLALADGGYYQQALDTLYSTLTHGYSSELADRDKGIDEVVMTELNQLIALHGAHLNTTRINRKLLADEPVDIRVVINWNMDNTDIDLWVTDPNGEKCFYSNKLTAAGGHISDDMTSGYGPEQFLLKKALRGQYKIETNYFGDHQVNIAGSTAVMAEIYTYYASGRQQRKVVTLQMPKEQKDGVLIGSFSF